MKNISKRQRRIILFSLPILLLSIPLIAMLFTKEANWSLTDFLLATVLLFSVVFFCELVFTYIHNTQKRIFICLGILFLFFVLWAELAVGIFNSSIAGS